MSIDWFPNDMGFTSCGQDGAIYFYDLYSVKEIGERNKQHEKKRHGVEFSSVVNLPNHPYNFLAVGNEKTIYTETEALKVVPRATQDVPNPLP